MTDDRLVRRIENRVRQFGREERLWRRGDGVVLAVSGGADSLCMLYTMARVASLDGLRLVVAHLHHGMRAEQADADQAFVEEQSRALGLPFKPGAASVPQLASGGRMGVEEAGRHARRSFLEEVLSENGAQSIATAHTRDDHVETVLLHLFRGAGLRGLTGIPPRGFGLRIRPLLCLSREDTVAFCRLHGLAPRHDPANDDLSFQRNRIRQVVLPLIRKEVNPSVDSALERTAAVAASALEIVEAEGRRVLDTAAAASPGTLLRKPLNIASAAAAAEAVRLAIAALRGVPEGIHFSDIDRVLAVSRTGGEASLANGGLAEASGDLLRIRYHTGLSSAGAAPAPPVRPIPVQIPGETTLPDGTRIVAAQSGDGMSGSPLGARLSVQPPLWVRYPLPGDRLRTAWRGGTRKLKDLFVEFRIPAWDRASWPIVLDGAGIVWIPGIAVAEHAAVTCPEDRPLTLEWRRESEP